MYKVICKIVTVKSPTMGEIRGERLVVAEPNKAGRNFQGDEIPVFRKPYFVKDYAIVSPNDLLRAIKDLQDSGYAPEFV